MPKRCSNPEIRAESGGFSALDQVNDKVTPACPPKIYTIGYFPMQRSRANAKDYLPMQKITCQCKRLLANAIAYLPPAQTLSSLT